MPFFTTSLSAIVTTPPPYTLGEGQIILSADNNSITEGFVYCSTRGAVISGINRFPRNGTPSTFYRGIPGMIIADIATASDSIRVSTNVRTNIQYDGTVYAAPDEQGIWGYYMFANVPAAPFVKVGVARSNCLPGGWFILHFKP